MNEFLISGARNSLGVGSGFVRVDVWLQDGARDHRRQRAPADR